MILLDKILLYLNAIILGLAAAELPLMRKARKLFPEAEDLEIKEWALLTDRWITRLFLTAILTFVAHLLSELITYSVSLKGLEGPGLKILQTILLGIAYAVFIFGAWGALKTWRKNREITRTRELEIPARNNIVTAIIGALIAFPVYIFGARQLLIIISNLE